MPGACKLIQDARYEIQDTGYKMHDWYIGFRNRMPEVDVGNNKLTEVSFPYKRFVLAD